MQERRQDALNLNGRIVTLEVEFTNQRKQTEQIVEGQRQSNNKLDQILLTMAEQRGAGKAIKIIWGTMVVILGFLGGWVGSITRHL